MMDLKPIPIGTITLRIEGISQEQTQSYHEIIRTLIMSGGLNIRNGKVILNFDDKTLREIEVNHKIYKK